MTVGMCLCWYVSSGHRIGEEGAKAHGPELGKLSKIRMLNFSSACYGFGCPFLWVVDEEVCGLCA